MILTFKDRMAIIYAGILPERHNVATMQLVKSIVDKVDFSELEQKSLNLQRTEVGFKYSTTIDLNTLTREVEFTPEESAILKQGSEALDKANNVGIDTLDTIITLLK
ncbi:MAG TPA: hypothetical protein VMW01_16700 [Williamwhitmania sp.]|nr:hypothetical protein [Williamwhitmania sp.]